MQFDVARPIVRLLGVPKVEVDGKTTTTFRSNRIPALLGWLASRPGVHQRDVVAAALWPDSGEQGAHHNLRQTLLYARKLLGDDSFIANRHFIELGPHVQTDVAKLTDAMDPALGVDERVEASVFAVDVYSGPFLEGYEDDWIDGVRSRCSRIYVTSLLRLADHFLPTNPAQALAFAERAVSEEPYLDGARVHKIKALRALGEESAAKREFNDFRDWIMAELGVEPSSLVAQALTDPEIVPLKPEGPLARLEGAGLVERLVNGDRAGQGIRLATAMVPAWIATGCADDGADFFASLLEAHGNAQDRSTHQRARVALAELYLHGDRQFMAHQILTAERASLTDPLALARALVLLGRTAISAYRPADAVTDLQTAIEFTEGTDYFEEAADAHHVYAEALIQLERFDEAVSQAEKSIELAKHINDLSLLGSATSTVAFALLRTGRTVEAHKATSDAMEWVADKDGVQAASTRTRIYRLLEEMGELSVAEEGYRRGVEDARKYDHGFLLTVALTYLGDLMTAKEEYQEAVTLHSEALAIRRRSNWQLGAATSLRGLGRACLALGKIEEARQFLVESSQLFLESDATPGHASALLELARVHVQAGDRELALRLAKRARDLLASMTHYAMLTIGPTGDNSIAEAQALVSGLEAL